MKSSYKVFVINPGSTSTKIALFQNDERLFGANVEHDVEELRACATIPEQLPLRLKTIRAELARRGLDLTGIDAVSTRSGGLVSLTGGVYRVNDLLYEHSKNCLTVRHPNTLGPQLARALAEEYGIENIFTVNPPDVDELDEEERVCGFHELSRESRGHPLNHKENGIRYAAKSGLRYEDMNLIICHMGGGVTVAAHRKGRMCCVNDSINGDGPIAPTRAGWLPATKVVRLCFSGRYTEAEMYDRITKSGGFIDHLGTADTREIVRRISEGDDYAKLIYGAFAYSVCKEIGACAAVLGGSVDAIILTGGMAHEVSLVDAITARVGWIAPVVVQAGEFEMEGLASGAIRALRGEEEVKEYTGVPVWTGFKGGPGTV